MIASVDYAAGGVENQRAVSILLDISENLVESGNFLGQILCFAFGVIRTVRPTHPGGNSGDPGEAAGLQNRSETLFDLVITGKSGISSGGEAFGPESLPGTRHAD